MDDQKIDLSICNQLIILNFKNNQGQIEMILINRLKLNNIQQSFNNIKNLNFLNYQKWMIMKHNNRLAFNKSKLKTIIILSILKITNIVRNLPNILEILKVKNNHL